MEKCLMVNNLRRWTFQWTLKASKGVGGGGGGGGGGRNGSVQEYM